MKQTKRELVRVAMYEMANMLKFCTSQWDRLRIVRTIKGLGKAYKIDVYDKVAPFRENGELIERVVGIQIEDDYYIFNEYNWTYETYNGDTIYERA